MADPRSVMQEFRFLEQKRQSGSLTPDEVARHAELRDLVGFEQPLPARGGFDVAAAAAQLRESLLPAGLRNRPLDAPPPPPAASTLPAPAEPAPAPAPVPPVEETYFNPASLGQEARPQAWNPDAPGYDPDAPYDEAAWIAAGYDPNVTYDWSALAAPEGAIAEPAPIQFGEYDAAGPSVAPVEPGASMEPPAALPEAGAWFDDAGAAAAAPPPSTLAFGEYDAPPPLELGEVAETLPGVTDDPSVPGGAPLELGGAPAGWLSDGAPDGGFELASDGSFGEPAPPQPVPWSGPDSPAAAERWESAPALDLSTPFEPFPVASAPLAAPLQVAAERPEQLEPEEILEPLLELIPEPAAPLASEPGERAWAPQAVDTGAPATGSSAGIGEPRDLGEVDSSFEIDVPPEFGAAHEAPHPPPALLDFESPAPRPLPATAGPVPVEGASTEPAVQARPEPEIDPAPAPAPAPAPSGGGTVVAGLHRVVVHTLDGAVLRGLLRDSNLEAPVLELDTGMPGPPTAVGTDTVKAIFFMLAAGDPPPEAHGKRVRVAFRDGRQVAGFSPDYQEGGVGFFMIPVDTRTNTGRIWVYQAAVKQVTIS